MNSSRSSSSSSNSSSKSSSSKSQSSSPPPATPAPSSSSSPAVRSSKYCRPVILRASSSAVAAPVPAPAAPLSFIRRKASSASSRCVHAVNDTTVTAVPVARMARRRASASSSRRDAMASGVSSSSSTTPARSRIHSLASPTRSKTMLMPTAPAACFTMRAWICCSSRSKRPLMERHLMSGGSSGYAGVCENTRPSRAVCDSSASSSSSPSPSALTAIW
mmetsp:Transcript_35083/g.87781  ORF Transcript_35083/g.87781 Transcript_35083/m.87781 type:complete len:219 (+) Transcript_35083:314-970(+)